MTANTTKKMKQIGFIMAMSILGTVILNSLAKRIAPVNAVRQIVNNGL